MDVPLLRSAALGAALFALAACGVLGNGAGRCAAAGSRPGLSVDIPAPDAARVSSASLRVCWDHTCRETPVRFRPSSRGLPMDCQRDDPADSADSCDAAAESDGAKHGFAYVEDLPTSIVRVTLRLRDAQGRTFLSRRIELIPEATFPNGPDCDEGAPQAGLTIVNGALVVR
ncbi:hypothetical protein BZB76_3417 [Actinomadura pelletieri DSM 43383]|uniref:LppP/LprE lipoprotein n=1 Tax=Actinomadura pelletieri DSM 43383 TaxID=1120940 RepID=A0A495QPI1_9ACTN|nr:hypothetical protein [Actinomadura pelletieri]RKS74894.1 hypothetical protein BZB76_3417 [Actinomadura pelletieri DSM 43383]